MQQRRILGVALAAALALAAAPGRVEANELHAAAMAAGRTATAALGPRAWLAEPDGPPGPGRQAGSGAKPADTVQPADTVPPSDTVLAADAVRVEEAEEPSIRGANDSVETGERMAGVGSAPGGNVNASIRGTFAPPPLIPFAGFSAEDDGSLGTANEVTLENGQGQMWLGRIGDGPHASTGDFDHYALELAAGQALLASTQTSMYDDGLDPVLVVYGPDGTPVAASGDGSPGDGPEAAVHLEVAVPGRYTVSVGGCCLPQSDPARSDSGGGAQSVGRYRLVLALPLVGARPPGEPIEPVVSVEDDGAYALANPVELTRERPVVVQGVIGDGPHGQTSGDTDFYDLGELTVGTPLTVDVDTDGRLDSFVVLWEATLGVVAMADDDGRTLDSLLVQEVPVFGHYFVSISSCCGPQRDPHHPGSGTGRSTTGSYSATISLRLGGPQDDVDVYLVDLQPGDVVSAAFAGAARSVEILDPGGALRMGGTNSGSGDYPSGSPLRHQGDIGVEHVAAVAGTYAVRVSGGPGPYRGELRIVRPPRGPQVVFVDFDGATVDGAAFGGRGDATLSPLAAFLWRWGLDPIDEDAVIDAVLAELEGNLAEIDGRSTGVVVLDSRDDPDPGHDPRVSRVVVGGSSLEARIPTVGIAESIDPGNTVRGETALVLLDRLSTSRGPSVTLSGLRRAPGVQLRDVVGTAIGAVASHEIGHLVGIRHTAAGNGVASLMDTGGDLADLLGVGPDGVLGSDDDVDVGFSTDEFEEFEGWTGAEETATRAYWGLAGDAPAIT